ncbi:MULTISPECIES: FeoC-like transcriptional regulator [unclassified Agarivorans]|uniref:FeoC-like transcriptional regulator n=1 Tax=unclassified Agarivorans TaxID=2636026 RepID=UPI0026E12CEF|nr:MULTISPECIES: FeoC-like transcriptional regulator [unclassified Agarivorans]MDO6684926.1 FeoC-like transcriptional regulator [Agarivorans sp. 3_MG-2023]MDO6714913.1 FeoC-like transcriptional regulator [Agarivorans sp. 2_MG-2023]
MILQALKEYIEANPGVMLSQVANHFSLSDDAALAMLQPWVKRHRLRLVKLGSCSGGCGCGVSEEQWQLYWQNESQIGVTC